jgi:hypothetical protein
LRCHSERTPFPSCLQSEESHLRPQSSALSLVWLKTPVVEWILIMPGRVVGDPSPRFAEWKPELPKAATMCIWPGAKCARACCILADSSRESALLAKSHTGFRFVGRPGAETRLFRHPCRNGRRLSYAAERAPLPPAVYRFGSLDYLGNLIGALIIFGLHQVYNNTQSSVFFEGSNEILRQGLRMTYV